MAYHSVPDYLCHVYTKIVVHHVYLLTALEHSGMTLLGQWQSHLEGLHRSARRTSFLTSAICHGREKTLLVDYRVSGKSDEPHGALRCTPVPSDGGLGQVTYFSMCHHNEERAASRNFII